MSEAWLSMSVLGGVYYLRQGLSNRPEWDRAAVISTLRAVETTASFDYATACEILDDLGEASHGPLTRERLFCLCIERAINRASPKWCEKVHLGRDVIRKKIPGNVAQCLEAAGLLANDDTSEAWWASLGASSRLRFSARKKEAGDFAEILSLRRERAQASVEGLAERPFRASVFNETLGYDVVSFRRTPLGVSRVHIEVKGCANSSLYFFVSQNEWKTALRLAPDYEFHLWNLEDKRLHIASVTDIAPSIPNNRGDGEWQTVLIHFGK